MPVRKKIPDKTIDEVLVACGRRCCLCFGLDADTDQKEGQVAHVDRDSSNNNADNLAWLCLTHHAGYDSRSRMTKAVTPGGTPPLPGSAARGGRRKRNPHVETRHAANNCLDRFRQCQRRQRGRKYGQREGPAGQKAADDRPAARHDRPRRLDAVLQRVPRQAVQRVVQKRRDPRTIARPFNHGVIRRNIESTFGSRVTLVSADRFEDLVAYLQNRINCTMCGKGSRHRNYHTFEEHVAKSRGG